jgi:hypothetical protein
MGVRTQQLDKMVRYELDSEMPRTCSVGLCKNNSNTVGLRFLQFLNEESYPERRKLWAARCNRKKPNGENWELNPSVQMT